MISRFLSFVILAPLAILTIVFCVSNRGAVPVSLDPFGTLPQFTYELPLFLVIMVSLIVGVVLGGIGTWLTQSHHRAKAWKRRQEIERLKREADDAKERLRQEREERAAVASLPSRGGFGRPALSSPGRA